MALGSFAFVAASIWLWTIGDLFVKLAAGSGILFFGLCGIYMLIKLFDNRPGLIISKDGLLDNSSAVSGHLIKWENITEFKILQIESSKLLLIFVNNPQEFWDQANLFKRSVMKKNYDMYGTPIGISSNTLQCNFDELLEILKGEMKKVVGK